MLGKVTADKLFGHYSGEEQKPLILKSGIRGTIDLVLNSVCKGKRLLKVSGMCKNTKEKRLKDKIKYVWVLRKIKIL
jgi:hypothetical protein